MTDIPSVRLADRDWPIPLLGITQNRVVTPAIMKLLPELGRIFAAVSAAQDGGTVPHLEITEETFDLMANAVYAAMTRGTPGLARAEFENLPISVFDLIAALQVVIQQSGAFKQGGDAAAGEARATVISTSTSSSPITASAPESPGPTS